MHTVLTIAGSDSSGGAGIQADLKAITMNGCYGMSVITALTAQNTTGVTGIMNVAPEFVKEELDTTITDIFPEATKIGMVSTPEIIEVIAAALDEYELRNIVVDPVMVATSGSKLIDDAAISLLEKELIPRATLITPNLPEAEILLGLKIANASDMEQAANDLVAKYEVAVLLKGGHAKGTASDYLAEADGGFWLHGEEIATTNTHGTGCTLSSAIASQLANGYELAEAVSIAKDYVTNCLKAGLDLGSGNGPLMHNYKLYYRK